MNYTEITLEKLGEFPSPSNAIEFDSVNLAASTQAGSVFLALEFLTPEGSKVLIAHPTQWLDLASTLYGLGGRCLELQRELTSRRELGLDLLQRAV